MSFRSGIEAGDLVGKHAVLPENTWRRTCITASLFLTAFFAASLSGERSASAQTVGIESKGLVACKSQEKLEALLNMQNVGEDSITDIYYKKLRLQGICTKLRPGERVNLIGNSSNPDIVKIIRLKNNKLYFLARNPFGSQN